ncbi:cobalamin-binding protein [Wenzhouxiangella marina]|uniref:ABC transporter substrate-binding protein n=1 Tax=Wenzhouxiangella marina TaxID=1579979 RepID=A0A0K0XVQ6_9GAMM|nr:cobalamin-binding protein [Wenzhouxiangella marina]AKS41755.1 ABC transporter substrate-binding protein [Wenzhouxiangella marina]MBB6086483.1 iron complex transport system substrate-binding protein [Wenzhouxiangella marina]
MRIVSHTCSNTEIVCALGRADWLVGVDDHSDFPPEIVSTLPRIGPDLDIDVERVQALKPDLVITSLTVPGHERCLERLQSAGLPLLLTQPQGLTDVIEDIRRIGLALDAATAARHLIEAFEQRLDLPPPAHAPVPILIEWWPKPVIVPGRRSWTNEMLERVGGVNPFADVDRESLEISTEQACSAQPEAIVMSWCGVAEDKYRPHIVTRREGWSELPAVRNGRVLPISEAWLGRPGPRLIEGFDRLAEVVRRCRE